MQPFLLFAEDEAQQVAMLTLACKQAGLAETSYSICGDGLQLVSFLEETEPPLGCKPMPSCIITDLRMPLVDGFGVLEWVRGNPRFQHLPVTLMTSLLDPELRARAEMLGATEVLLKPNSFFDLVALIQKWHTPASIEGPLDGDAGSLTKKIPSTAQTVGPVV
jgi:CheY-like chemotaxis protein